MISCPIFEIFRDLKDTQRYLKVLRGTQRTLKLLKVFKVTYSDLKYFSMEKMARRALYN